MLSGQVAVVFGAEGRLGQRIVSALSAAGSDIIVCQGADSEPETAAAALRVAESNGRRGFAMTCDLNSRGNTEEALTSAVGAAGGLHVAVWCSAVVTFGGVLDTSEQEWARVLNANLTAARNGLAAAASVMRARQQPGSLIVVSSSMAQKAVRGAAAYVVAAHGLLGLARAMAHEVAEDSIRVNTVLPSLLGPGLDDRSDVGEWMAERKHDVLDSRSRLPLERGASEQDVADAVLWLASNEARFVTAVALPVEAGLLAR